MFPRRAIRRLRACCRSLLAVATLAGLLIGTVGFSVVPPGRAGAAFPCQGGTCGCQSASDCWLGCCCLTPAQRLAWAKANGVTPPAELLRLVAEEKSKTRPIAACCAGHAKRACCSHGNAAGCCAKPDSETAVLNDTGDDSSTPGFHPRRCRGPGHWWVAGGQPLALPERPAAASLPAGCEPVLIRMTGYALDADPPPTRPG